MEKHPETQIVAEWATEESTNPIPAAKLKNAGMPTLLTASVVGDTVRLELYRANMPSLVTQFSLSGAIKGDA